MTRLIIAAVLAAMLAMPAWAHMDEACLEAIIDASRVEAKFENAKAKCLKSASEAEESTGAARNDKADESATADSYVVDPSALAASPDEAQLREEIIEHFLRPCHTQILRSQGVKENMITVMLPRMQEATMEQVGGMMDLLMTQLKGSDPKTRAAMHEVNYEACLTAAGVKNK